MLEGRNLLSTFTVDHLADDMVGNGLNGSLRYCITNATDGDDIQFGVTGTINLAGALPDLTHSISIEGPGPGQLTVRRDTGGSYYRIFTVDSGTTVGIAGLTISNGLVNQGAGGGISNSGTLTVDNASFSGNNASGGGQGGAINNTGTLTVTACTLSGNNVSGLGSRGGGISNSGTLTVHNASVSGSQAWNGGGIYNAGSLTVTDTTFNGNLADGTGGAFGGAINNEGTLTVTACTLSHNFANGGPPMGYSGGGGISNSRALTVTASTFSGNQAYNGGGIYNAGTLTVTTSPFSGNGATAGGGIEGSGTLTVSASTFSGNSASNRGGGIYISTPNVPPIRNTILARNTAPTAPDVSGPLNSQGYNLIGIGDGGSGYADTDLVGTAENPLDPVLGPLQDNGGPTPTMALLPGSRALNAGDPDQLGSTDQRGVVRSGGVNIGAYQASATAFLVSAPRRVRARVPFDVTVTAVDPFGQVAVGYTGTVTFSTSDPRRRVVLPADYAFTLNDGGVHPFTDTGRGETTLRTHGRQTIAVADTADGSITGQVSVRVRHPRPSPGPAPGHGYLGTAPVPGEVVWLPARSIHHGVGDIEPLGWDWLDGADPVLV
jgi:hypothetical protein